MYLYKKIITCGAKRGDIPSCFAEELTALSGDQPPKHCCYWQPGQQLASSVFLSPVYITSTCAMFYWSEVCVCVCVCVCMCVCVCVCPPMYVSVCVCVIFLSLCESMLLSMCVSWRVHECVLECVSVAAQHVWMCCLCNSGCVCLCFLFSFLLDLFWPNKLFPTVPSLFWIIYWQPEVQNIKKSSRMNWIRRGGLANGSLGWWEKSPCHCAAKGWASCRWSSNYWVFLGSG